MADQDTNWTWNFSGPTTESKAQSRAILPKEIAWELTGVDGNEVGGLRTHPGFKALTSFSAGLDVGLLVNVFPISLLMDATSFVCGHIYFTTYLGNTYAYIHVTSDGSNYDTSTDVTNLTWSGTTNAITVECIGRFAYIFVKGQTPKSLRITNAAVSTATNFVVTSGGPGTPPVVKTISTATVDNVTDYTDSAKIPAGSRNGTGTYNQDMHAYWTATTLSAPAVKLKLGAYGFAVQYMSTVTGRKSVISNVAQVEFTAADSCVRLRIAPFGANAEYDKALIYRTVKNSGVGGTLHLEKTLSIPAQSTVYSVTRATTTVTIVTVGVHGLQVGDFVTVAAAISTGINGSFVVTGITNSTTFTYTTTSGTITTTLQGGSVTLKVRNYDVEVQDSSLVYLDVYIDKGNMDTSMPRGSVAAFMGSTLFVSGIGGTDSATPGNVTPQSPPRAIGDLRWSSTGEIQPENFKPSNRWIPRTPGNEIIGMRTVGNYMMAFSNDRAYRIGRAGQFIKVEEVHLGYGLSGIDALDGVGGMVYFVSGGGMKAISAEGKIDDVAGLDALINRLWLSQKSEIKMAFDAVGQCLTIMKPPTALGAADGAAVCMWFGTNRITELADLPFQHVRSSTQIVDGQSQRRAVFYKRNSLNSWGAYIVDHERTRSPFLGLCGGGFQLIAAGAGIDVQVEDFDCAAYYIGTGERTTYNSIVEDLAVETVSIAPILFRWVGGNVGAQGDPGQPEFKDFFRQKQLSTCHPYFEVISTPNYSQIGATWRSLAYRGTEETPLTIGVPTDKTGQVVSTFTSESVNFNNAGMLNGAPFGKHGVVWSSLSVGFRCDIVGVDLRLLAFNVVGKVLDTSRRYV